MWYYIYYISYPVCMWMLLCCFHKLSHALNGRPVIHDNADMGGQHLDMWIALAKSEKPILIVQRTEQVRSYNLLWCWWLCCVHQLYTGLHPIWLCEWNVVAAGGVHVTTIYHSTNIITPRVCAMCEYARMIGWLFKTFSCATSWVCALALCVSVRKTEVCSLQLPARKR